MGNKIALLIGVAEYEKESSLPPCERDLDLISTIVTDCAKFDDVLLLGQSPKSAEAKAKITAFVRKHQADDIDEVFVYYTGHGARYSDDFIYLFSDYDEDKLEQTSLANSEFDSMLRSLGSELTVKVVDACHAGTEYIKSSNDLRMILEKSSSDSFKKTYFLFSSSSIESSIALNDYSVFTKSLAQSLVGFEGQEIRYRDVMAYISDDKNVKNHQTPLFIQQADNTEIFCAVTVDLSNDIKTKLAEYLSPGASEKNDSVDDQGSTIDSEISESDKLIRAVRIKSKDYCDEEQASTSLEKYIQFISSHAWSDFVSELYASDVILNDDVQPSNATASVAKWLDENDEPYFIELLYDDEAYETKEKVEYEDVYGLSFSHMLGRQKRIEYQPVTKYRAVLSGYDLTAQSPCKSVSINLSPTEEILPWIKVFFLYVFSKRKLTIFYKHEIEKELSWDSRELNNTNQWKIGHCELNDIQSIKETVRNAFVSLEKSIAETIRACVESSK